jgi:hypothetical protein
MANYIPIRQQLWQNPVFSPEEGEVFAPTRHQVDVWKAEASNFAATLDELPYGRRDWWDVLATRAYQAGADQQLKLDAEQIEQSYQAGADQELEACCEWNSWRYSKTIADQLRVARRPKPPSLKEQALNSLQKIEDNDINATYLDSSIIRKALEALPNE